MSVIFPAVYFNVSMHPSIETGFLGNIIFPLEMAACVPKDIQATRFKLMIPPVKAPYMRKNVTNNDEDPSNVLFYLFICIYICTYKYVKY